MPVLYLLAIAIGTLALWLPVARAGESGAPLTTALFTAVSAVAVTGLIIEDTPVYWSFSGQIAILVLIQMGGLGTKTAASFLALAVGRGFVLRRTLERAVEQEQLNLSDALYAVKLILAITLIVEIVTTAILTARFHTLHAMPLPTAFWHGLFQAVSAFNNSGFSTFSDSMTAFRLDAAILLPVAFAVIIGSLGFPVLQDVLGRGRGPADWTLHTRITLAGTAALLAVGFLVILIAESGNAETLGPMGWGERLLNAFFHSAMPRTAGFNSLDVGVMRSETVLLHYALMFIGGGSAGTAGGIKITTVAVLFLILIHQVRGRARPEVQGHTLSYKLASQAVTVIMLALSVIFLASFYLAMRTPHPLTDILFECVSAFATVGLSRGITDELPVDAQMVLVVLMFLGRVGTITAAAWLAMGATGAAAAGDRASPVRTAERDPIIG